VTKEQPKEMLPVFARAKNGDLCLKPTVQLVFEHRLQRVSFSSSWPPTGLAIGPGAGSWVPVRVVYDWLQRLGPDAWFHFIWDVLTGEVKRLPTVCAS
jgi:hypothetical protein